MSTNRDLSRCDKNTSARVVAFPAGRRNVEWYNSRILSDDNFRRSFQSAIPSPAGNGTVILDYSKSSSNKLNFIAFLIQGYYFYLNNPEDPTLQHINSQLGVVNGEQWVYIYQDKVEGLEDEPRVVTDFYEFACKDENGQFYGLFSGGTKPDYPALSIPIVVPGGPNDEGIINPAIDTTKDGDYYKPWFQSSAKWAASSFSDKNKIWVDDVYDVPHICIDEGDRKKWIPLGAVYKTSRSSR